MTRVAWNKGKTGYSLKRPVDERFWEKVDMRTPEECWPWLGSKDRFGRGYFVRDKRVQRAPRVAWSLHRDKPFPEHLDACHTCDDPSCCNPHHIWAGTESENLTDAARKGRIRTGPRPAPLLLSPERLASVRARHANGISVAKLATELGVTYSRMRRLLNKAA